LTVAGVLAPATLIAGRPRDALYDPLMKRDVNGELKPYLAESMEPSDDLTQWTLKLRPDITLHDGTPLNAEALKSNVDDYHSQPGSQTASAYEGVTLEVVDDLTVRYTLAEPDSSWPAFLALAAGWPFSPAAAAKYGDDLGAHPVGTGPFVFDSRERDSRLVVKKDWPTNLGSQNRKHPVILWGNDTFVNPATTTPSCGTSRRWASSSPPPKHQPARAARCSRARP
jgi:ABC-type transport system substrate-binding protein